MIGISIYSLEGGGAERVVLNIANEFYNQGIPFILILRYKRGTYLNNLNPNIKIVELNTKNPLKIISGIIKICKKNNIISLLSVDRYNNILGIIACRLIKVKIIVREASTFDGLFKHDGQLNIKNFILLHLMKLLYPYANNIIANSKDTANDILNYINISREKLIVLNNPIFNAKLIELSKEDVNDPLFDYLTKPIVISMGRLIPSKNFELLLRSFRIVKNTLKSANLVILGTGIKLNQLLSLRNELHLGNDVHFLGFVNNPYKYLASSDIFVLSSNYEGFGNVVVEALAVGLPVVSTNCPGGPHEILENGKFGQLVPMNNEIAMADAIIEGLKYKPKRDYLIQRARYYSIEEIVNRYRNILTGKDL